MPNLDSLDDKTYLIELVVGLVETTSYRNYLLTMTGLEECRSRLPTVDITPPAMFGANLVDVCMKYGNLKSTGQPAIVALLKYVRGSLDGQKEHHLFLDTLLNLYTPQDLPVTEENLKIKILWLSSNPWYTMRLDLVSGQKAIAKQISGSLLANKIQYIPEFDVLTNASW